MLALVDTHHHFYDPQAHYYPWLNDAGQPPHRYGDHSALKRPYLPADYRRDTAGVGPWLSRRASCGHGACRYRDGQSLCD